MNPNMDSHVQNATNAVTQRSRSVWLLDELFPFCPVTGHAVREMRDRETSTTTLHGSLGTEIFKDDAFNVNGEVMVWEGDSTGSLHGVASSSAQVTSAECRLSRPTHKFVH